MVNLNDPVREDEIVDFSWKFSLANRAGRLPGKYAPLLLPADHFFFVPQIGVNSGDFYWLSASRPIVAPGTPILPDLQAWIRNGNLDPDWLRIGMDIVGGNPAPTFNMAFEVDGEALPALPEPGSLLLLGTGLGLVARRVRRKTT